MSEARTWFYPAALPVVAQREQIIEAICSHRVVVVVSDTGSGKTTQLPKMACEALAQLGMREKLLVGCTQPRRIAAVSVAQRVTEELREPLGELVGYHVRFDEKTSAATRVKFMTDGILLAEIQSDAALSRYGVLIIDEAHERSVNIDFLLGYLKRLLVTRRDLRVILSSATLDAGAFAEFFASEGEAVAVIEAPGRVFPVEEHIQPPEEDEELPQQVARAVDWLTRREPMGDVLVFLPGEREIRECADALDGRNFSRTEILPLFARLSLQEQQRVFHPGGQRRIVLATNVAETSLTIPGIVCVIDSGWARVSRWSPARGVQRLQMERISRASARQRKGRCGRIREGIYVRLGEVDEEFAEFTDPEIRRSSLAGVMLRMKMLGLPAIEDFALIDPPSPKAVSEGYRTLREVGALDREKRLTEMGRQMARMPLDPRLARMLLEAKKSRCLAELLPIIAALELNDPRERPAEQQKKADAAQARWKDEDSDFLGLLRMWLDVQKFRDERGKLRRNQLRKFCGETFLNFRRVLEWMNLHDELRDTLQREWRWNVPELAAQFAQFAPSTTIHGAILAGVPRQFGLWDKEARAYRSAGGGQFAIFPGSNLFGGKRAEWVLAVELVETSRLWARKVAKIEPDLIEKMAPHLCKSRYGKAHWDEVQGAVYGEETVICGGLTLVSGRRVHYGRVDPVVAHEVFLREGVMAGKLRQKCEFLTHLETLHERANDLEHKLRRVGGLWSEEAVLEFFSRVIPKEIHTLADFHAWRADHESSLFLRMEDALWDPNVALDEFPDVLMWDEQEIAVYYHAAPGQRDDGITFGIHVEQIPSIPDWFPSWGVDGNLADRAEHFIRSLPKDLRRVCQPNRQAAWDFYEQWRGKPRSRSLEIELAHFLRQRTNWPIEASHFDARTLPPEWVTKLWICDDEGEELAFGDDFPRLQRELTGTLQSRSQSAANQEWEQHGLKTWPDTPFPDEIFTSAGRAFLALLDEGECVGVVAFAQSEVASHAHRAGCARLLSLQQPEQLAHTRKTFPLSLSVKFELPRLGEKGTSLDDLLLLSAEGALGLPLPRDPETWAQRASHARGEWFHAAKSIAKHLDACVAELAEIRKWLAMRRGQVAYAAIVADLDEQLAWLFREKFAWRAGFSRLPDVARYLKAMAARVKRIESLPLVKDLEKMQRIRAYHVVWWNAYRREPQRVDLDAHAWQLQEFRVSLFAPDVAVRAKISEKILAEWQPDA